MRSALILLLVFLGVSVLGADTIHPVLHFKDMAADKPLSYDEVWERVWAYREESKKNLQDQGIPSVLINIIEDYFYLNTRIGIHHPDFNLPPGIVGFTAPALPEPNDIQAEEDEEDDEEPKYSVSSLLKSFGIGFVSPKEEIFFLNYLQASYLMGIAPMPIGL